MRWKIAIAFFAVYGLLGNDVPGDAGGCNVTQVSSRAALAWLYLVVFGSLLAFTAYIWLLGVTSIAKVVPTLT
jgi:hypothetical protein